MMVSLSKDQKQKTEPLLTDSKFLTTIEVAEYLRLTTTTVINLAVSGELPGFKIGKSWRFDRDEVMTRIAEVKQRARAAD